INLLNEFKEGIYNTLVGTSVAEEGLDIEECDLVVFYDVVPSAIRSIQRRGRTGRKKEGKVFVLMAEGTRDEGYYWAERSKEKSMHLSLDKIKNSDSKSKSGQSNLFNFISDENNEKNESKENIVPDLNLVKKIKDAENVEIICDNRETASPVVRTLSLMGIRIKLEQLSIADYVISERLGIERKSAKDFNDSIIDGRLFAELSELGENFSRPILILEGDIFQDSNISENALYGAITSIILNLGITIYKTQNVIETAKFLYQLARKEQTDTSSQPKLRFEKAPIEPSDLLEYIVAGIPGVNTLRAKNLLKELKTIQNICLADIPDLTKIDKIGKKIAEEIYKLSRYKYKNDR
ncbi:MAG: ERCC4 domain-containing protein, partial [Candidatus Lokiarchaeia archaeon]|nr:ERCC4 domain-containing protein [Candidatus Lokiarchaeia archaeon]